MRCAHCGEPLSILRYFARPRFDGGFRCTACSKISYVGTGEQLRRGYILNVIGTTSIPLTAQFLKPSLGSWSIFAGLAVGLPILYATTFLGLRRCATVPSLPDDVLERRANFTKLILAIFAIVFPLALLGLFRLINPGLAMLIVFPAFLLFFVAGFATVFSNLRDER
jgi:hypothetical protein